MKKMISSQNEPFELCVEIQRKIKDKRKRINSIKSLIDETNESQRNDLNNEMFKNIEEVGNDEFLTYSGISSPSVYIKELAISGK